MAVVLHRYRINFNSVHPLQKQERGELSATIVPNYGSSAS